MSGGYKVISFHNTNLESSNTDGVTISGIYDSIENSYNKVLLFSDIVIDGVEKNNVFENVTVGDNVFTVTIYGNTVTITNTDNVKIGA